MRARIGSYCRIRFGPAWAHAAPPAIATAINGWAYVAIDYRLAGNRKNLAGHPYAFALYAFFGVTTPTQMSDLYDFASPTAYVMPERAAAIPPFCILHSTGDPVVPYSQSVLLQSRLRAVGVSVELHAYDLDSHAVPAAAFAEIFRFLNAQL